MTLDRSVNHDTSFTNAISRDPYDLLPFGACVIDHNLDIHAWNSTLSDWTGIEKSSALTMNLGVTFPELLTPYLKDRLTDVFSNGHNVILSPALHKRFFPIRPTRATHGPEMVQKTQIRPSPTDRRFALVIIEDVTAELQQTDKLRRERRELKASETRLLKNRDELRDAKREAEAASRAKSEFLSNMSHEIRTPMTAILGFVDLLRENCQDQSQIEALDTITRNSNHLLEIINDILDLSKVEAGRMTVEKITCSPYKIVSEIVSLMQVRADAKGLSLSAMHCGLVPETIQSDPSRLRQILINIVGNAIKFTETGSVRLTMKLIDDPGAEPLLKFEVTDTGIGLNVQQVSHLFQPFAQADSSTSRKFGGTGLGLAISKRMAEMLGGDIRVRSTPGEGSTFSVAVLTGPLEGVKMVDHPSEIEAPGEQVEKLVSQDALLNCRLLLAEDGPDNQRLISFVLKKAGAEVTVAENGQIALDLALAARDEAAPFDVILMDMQMPVLDGYAATRQLREAGYAGPIIALTAHAMTSDRQKCLDAGCDDYSTKPIDRKMLIDLVHNYAMNNELASVSGKQEGETLWRTT